MKRSLFVCVLLVALSYAGVLVYMLPRLHIPAENLHHERASPAIVVAVPTLPMMKSSFLRDALNQNEQILKLSSSSSTTSLTSSTSTSSTSSSTSTPSPSIDNCNDPFSVQMVNKLASSFEFDVNVDGKPRPWRFLCAPQQPQTSALAPAAIFTHSRTYEYEPLANLTKSRLIGSFEQEGITRLINGPLMRAYFPAVDPLFVRPKPFRRCAVIGSSGLLLNSSLGASIDAHDAVMRFNWPLLAGYEADVGRKTTHMLVNRKSLHASHWPPFVTQHDYGANITVVTLLHFIDEFAEWLHWARRERAPRLLAVSPDFRRLAAKTLRDALHADLRAELEKKIDDSIVASSGFIGAMMALAACDHVTLAGFGASIHSGNGHYWAPAGDVKREWSIHNFDGEQNYYRLLELKRTYPAWLDEYDVQQTGSKQRATFEFVQNAQMKVMLDSVLRHVAAKDALPDPDAARRAFYNGADRAAKFEQRKASFEKAGKPRAAAERHR